MENREGEQEEGRDIDIDIEDLCFTMWIRKNVLNF